MTQNRPYSNANNATHKGNLFQPAAMGFNRGKVWHSDWEVARGVAGVKTGRTLKTAHLLSVWVLELTILHLPTARPHPLTALLHQGGILLALFWG
jgi:hypothetical protein